MHAAIDESVLQQLRMLVLDQGQNVPIHDPLVEALQAFGGSFLGTLGLGSLVAALAMGLVFLAYRPRTPRGAIWLPFFGLFGGTPTLYLHTHPPSFLGFRSRPRRRR